MTDDKRLDLEFAYTPHGDSCRDVYSVHVYCRRPAGHADEHAAGFGGARVRWVARPRIPRPTSR